MLSLMRRGTTREKTEELLHTIREKVPGIAIRTTMITGHPGEGEAEFEEMMDFIERTRFERLGVFTYSHEEHTHAFGMKDDVPEKTKLERADRVMELQENISDEINQHRIGQVLKVLIDRKEGEHFIGRTEFDSPEVDNEVLVNAENSYLRIGDFSKIRITDATAFDLYGEAVE